MKYSQVVFEGRPEGIPGGGLLTVVTKESDATARRRLKFVADVGGAVHSIGPLGSKTFAAIGAAGKVAEAVHMTIQDSTELHFVGSLGQRVGTGGQPAIVPGEYVLLRRSPRSEPRCCRPPRWGSEPDLESPVRHRTLLLPPHPLTAPQPDIELRFRVAPFSPTEVERLFGTTSAPHVAIQVRLAGIEIRGARPRRFLRAGDHFRLTMRARDKTAVVKCPATVGPHSVAQLLAIEGLHLFQGPLRLGVELSISAGLYSPSIIRAIAKLKGAVMVGAKINGDPDDDRAVEAVAPHVLSPATTIASRNGKRLAGGEHPAIEAHLIPPPRRQAAVGCRWRLFAARRR